MSKKELKIPPVFECFAKFVSLDNSRVEIIPTHSYVAENGRVEFTFKIPNSYFGDQSKQIADLEAKLAERCKEIAIRNQKLNELKNELHKRNESLERKKQQVGDVHKAVKQAKRESAIKGRQVCKANNEVVQYQKQIKQLKQQLAEKEKQLAEYSDINNALNSGLKDRCISCEEEHNQDKISFAVEQLEKVKEEFDCIYSGDTYTPYQIADKIDNQIKELKEMK